MQDKVDFIKATVIGGVFFLIPLAVVVLLVGKLVEVMKGVAGSHRPCCRWRLLSRLWC